MNKKRILPILLAFCMVLTMTACDSSKDSVPVSDAEYSEYAGYQFSGTDPWGGTLSITIRTIVDGKMEWTFTDVFDNHTLYQEQAGTVLEHGAAEFDISGSDVQDKDTTFEYRGTLELKDGRVIANLLSGSVMSDSPEGGSASRMADALLDSGLSTEVILEKPDPESLTTYTVQEGDSLHSIAEEFGISTKDLVVMNQTVIMETAKAHGYEFDDVTEYAKYLFPGEELIIPGSQQNS